MGTFYDREIEYLESTGTQYIDTGITIVYATDVVEMSLNISITSGSTRQLNGANGALYFGVNASSEFEVSSAAAGTYNSNFHNWYLHCETGSKVTGTIDGTSYQGASVVGTGTYEYAIFLFALGGRDNAAASFFVSQKLGNAVIRKNGVVVRDFIPVRVGNVGYLFDRVSCQLFGNAGTGSFVLGPDMYDSRIEYVGIRQGNYIRTDYIPTGNKITFETQIRFRGYPTTQNYAMWFTARTDANHSHYRMIRSTANNVLLLGMCNIDSGEKALSITLGTGTLYHIRMTSGSAYLNNTGVTLTAANTTADVNTAYLDIGDNTTSRGVNEDVYYFKVFKEDVLVREFMPVRKGQVAYLYDRITNQLFGNSGTGNLLLGNDVPDIPSDYDEEVEYITFDGTQSIDTGLYGDLNTDVKVTCKCPTTYNMNVIGARNSNGTNSCEIFYGSPPILYADFYNNSTSRLSANDSYHNWVTIQTNKNLRQIDALNKTVHTTNTTQFSTEFVTPNTLRIGGFEGVLSVAFRNFMGYMGAVQIRKNGTLVRDYIPVRKNGVGYLYDKITQKMFGNEFSSSFAVGHDTVWPSPVSPSSDGVYRYYSRRELMIEGRKRLPYGYVELEYIQNTTGTWSTSAAYIDTGIRPAASSTDGDTYSFEGAWSREGNLTSNWDAVFGADNGGSGASTWHLLYSGKSVTRMGINTNTKGGKTINLSNSATGVKHTFKISTSSVTIDNTTTSAPTGKGYTITTNLLLFRRVPSGQGFPMKLYYFKVFKSGVLLMDLIPCKNRNNVVGMFDFVSGKFFGSANSGTFVAGEIKYK